MYSIRVSSFFFIWGINLSDIKWKLVKTSCCCFLHVIVDNIQRGNQNNDQLYQIKVNTRQSVEKKISYLNRKAIVLLHFCVIYIVNTNHII